MTSETHGLVLSKPSDLEISFTRTFKAPAALVFDAWTKCEHLKQWWGMPHIPIHHCDIDLRPGGQWRYLMRSPDGTAEIAISGVYRQVDRPALLVTTEAFDGDHFESMGGECVNTMTLAEAAGVTTMAFTSLYGSREARDRALHSGFDVGLEESFQLLDRHLATPAYASTSAPEIVVARVLHAPQDLVFAAFTDPVHVSNWWGPRGFTTITKHHDLRPGGTWEHTMIGPDGTEYPNLTEFIEVDPPNRLVYRVRGDDGPAAGVVFTATVTFSPAEGGTRVEMRSAFPSFEARDRVVREVGAIQGAIDTLERLEEYLATTA